MVEIEIGYQCLPAAERSEGPWRGAREVEVPPQRGGRTHPVMFTVERAREKLGLAYPQHRGHHPVVYTTRRGPSKHCG